MLLILRHLGLSGLGVGALVLIALVLRRLAPCDAVLRYRLMVAALLSAAFLLPLQVLTAELSPRPHPAPSALVPIAPARVLTTPTPAAANGSDPRSTEQPSSLIAPKASARDSAGVRVAPILLGIHFAGALLVLALHGIRSITAWRLLRTARPVTDTRVRQLWQQVTSDLRRSPELLECASLNAPACRALGRPAVILPTASAALDDDTLLASLQHEVIHLRRRDGTVALLAAGVTAVLWFQPLVWVFVRVLAADREHSCDALVVRATRRPRSYALALLRFCDPATSPRRSVSLMGFESARSIRRRITMLAHAMQPAARRRNALVLGFAFAGLVATSAAHTLLTAAAGPGPALSTELPVANPRMSAEVRAPADGRSDAQVYERLMGDRRTFQPAVQRRDGSWGFFVTEPPAYPPGTWLTDQETVLSADDARIDGDTLLARHIRLSLPEGSKLRAVFEGESVTFEPGPKDRNRILVTGGTVRIVDEHGVTRVRASAPSDRDDITLALTSTLEAGEFNFELTANGGSIPVLVTFDPGTGVPEGESQPPHGAIRWKLRTPEDAPGACQLKMQWIYDLSQLRRPDGC
jgi:beta-lactamase regulating signal transducer with metallopeptidase domain